MPSPRNSNPEPHQACLFALHGALHAHARALGDAAAAGRRAEVALTASSTACSAPSEGQDTAAAAAAGKGGGGSPRRWEAGRWEAGGGEDVQDEQLLQELCVELGLERSEIDQARLEALARVRAAAARAEGGAVVVARGGLGAALLCLGDEEGEVREEEAAAEAEEAAAGRGAAEAEAAAALAEATEINAICVVCDKAKPLAPSSPALGPAALLVLLPAGLRVDLKWLALVLGVRRRGLPLRGAPNLAQPTHPT